MTFDIDWPHAPPHRWEVGGVYFVTVGTYQKIHYFHGAERLRYLHDTLLALCREQDCRLEAWAVFPNHYHLVARPSGDFRRLLALLHERSAKWVNAADGQRGRKVWHNFRESLLTHERSWLARLNYTHQNAVKHGLVRVATQYPWCSAAWFERTATAAWQRTVGSFKIDRVNVEDDF